MKQERTVKQKDMDQTLEDTFPASDPPSWSMPQPAKELDLKDKESKGRPRDVNQKPFGKEDYLSSND